PRARAAFQNALAIRETLAERDPANLNWQRDLAAAYERVASLTYGDGDKEGALAIYRTALPVRKKLAAADPDNVQRQRDMATNLDRIGSILIELERKDEARDALREGLAIIERLAMAAPDSIQWQLDLVTVLFKLAYANDEPRARLEQARDIIRKLEADGKLSAAQKSWIELIDYSLANLPN
ncbi:MAG: hypothetical protein QOG83_434, partial [Alphaproteobacteria bacterium]|nr:hypothetical protein [Alphaproteobacteria bacterium]